jgi:uncharacterized protein YqeY
MFRTGGREEKAADEEAEAAILAEFMPAQLSEEEVETLVRQAIADSGASGPAEMGKVMSRLVPDTKGRVDGRVLSETVRRLLAS